MTTRRGVLPLMFALLLAAAPGAFGQCFSTFNDDGFDTGCCGPVVPNLPNFPAQTVTSDYGALFGCQQLFVVPPFPVTFSAPQWVLCDYAIVNVFIQLTPNDTISGMLLAKYVRTWGDASTPVLAQVYRFLVNGDLICNSSSSIVPCTTLLPRCAATGNVVHFDGHLDYSCNPLVSSTYQLSYSLNHMQGCVSHAPWSAIPLGGTVKHDDFSYHIVGPAPFTFAASPLPQGAVLGESVRSSYLRMTSGFVYNCMAEARVPNVVGANFLITQVGPHCNCASVDPCTTMPVNCLVPTVCYAEQFITGVVCCPFPGNVFQGFPIGGTPISNTGFLGQSIGSYGPGMFYPSNTTLSTYFGVLTYNDPCLAANWNIHAVVGVGTSGGFAMPFNNNTSACGPPPFLATTFIDLQNVLLLSTAPFLFQGYGSLSAADVVWSLDL
jgi:hypothetical protein